MIVRRKLFPRRPCLMTASAEASQSRFFLRLVRLLRSELEVLCVRSGTDVGREFGFGVVFRRQKFFTSFNQWLVPFSTRQSPFCCDGDLVLSRHGSVAVGTVFKRVISASVGNT